MVSWHAIPAPFLLALPSECQSFCRACVCVCMCEYLLMKNGKWYAFSSSSFEKRSVRAFDTLTLKDISIFIALCLSYHFNTPRYCKWQDNVLQWIKYYVSPAAGEWESIECNIQQQVIKNGAMFMLYLMCQTVECKLNNKIKCETKSIDDKDVKTSIENTWCMFYFSLNSSMFCWKNLNGLASGEYFSFKLIVWVVNFV